METLRRNRIILAVMTALAIGALFIIVLCLFKPAADVQLASPLSDLNKVIVIQKESVAVYKKAIADMKSKPAKFIADWNNPDIPGDFPLHKAVRLGLKERVETLIANGADINARDETDRTPLQIAVMYFNRNMMHLLVEKGADVNIRDSDGHTTLYYAVESGQKDMAEYLRKNGAQE